MSPKAYDFHRLDTNVTDTVPWWELGTVLMKDWVRWRYCRAGEDLRMGDFVVPRVPDSLDIGQITPDILYGDIVPANGDKTFGSIWIDVSKGRYFWLQGW
jgi:hypothetical protein